MIFSTQFEGIGKFFTPYITGNTGKRITPTRLKEVLPANNQGQKLVPQILVRSVREFEFIIQPICELGYKEVNINMGCPFPMVVRRGRGAGLLHNYQEIEAILDKADRLPELAISLKIRLGQNNNQELNNLIPLFNDHRVAEVIIHPRTAAQLYNGQPDLSSFRIAAEKIIHPVVYNGDIYSRKIFSLITGTFPNTSHFMLGRGILMNPCLAEELNVELDYSAEVRKKKIKLYHDRLFSLYSSIMSGEKHVLDKMKGYWSFLSLMFENPHRVFKTISKVRSGADYTLAVESVFSGTTVLTCPAVDFSINPLE